MGYNNGESVRFKEIDAEEFASLKREGQDATKATVALGYEKDMTVRRFAKEIDITVINLVRKDAHVEFLHNEGEKFVLNINADNFSTTLQQLSHQLEATAAIDAVGGELTGTNESVYDFARGERVRGTYGIAAIPGQVVFDQSNDLLNPTRGYRLKLNLSPETSVRGAVRPYARTMVEGTFYYPFNDSLVIAGRARAGAIFGIDRDDLAPSRRYYGGGGGSVRGYGFQRLGPFDPQGNPVGGRSLNEFALEARYRFGNFGIVPFVDAGNSYESTLPTGKDLRFGAGIGGRFYTNFGPLRVDVATPLNPRPGDGKVALYISIGQAF
jgi:outer membrane translocation and assembly module TamA